MQTNFCLFSEEEKIYIQKKKGYVVADKKKRKEQIIFSGKFNSHEWRKSEERKEKGGQHQLSHKFLL